MNHPETYYIDLISRYFSGEITEEELRDLSDWTQNDTRNEEIFRQYAKTWQLLESQNLRKTIDINKEWQILQTKINSSVNIHSTAENIPDKHESKTRPLNFFYSWKVAAAVAVFLVSSFFLYLLFSKPADIVVTAQNENMQVVLPDGSVVSLYQGSEISYPEKFTSASRKIALKGEAYFKVAHDKTKPFFVTSGDARVEVLGTQFNVNTNTASNTMEVVLTSGKVSVYYKEMPAEKVLLLPGEKAELITEAKKITKTINTDPNYNAWETHYIVFENESLSKAITTLEHVYQIQVMLTDKKLSEYKVTATFDNQTLESVLEVLSTTLDLQVKKDGKSFIISGK